MAKAQEARPPEKRLTLIIYPESLAGLYAEQHRRKMAGRPGKEASLTALINEAVVAQWGTR